MEAYSARYVSSVRKRIMAEPFFFFDFYLKNRFDPDFDCHIFLYKTPNDLILFPISLKFHLVYFHN